jgi:acid phosphatase
MIFILRAWQLRHALILGLFFFSSLSSEEIICHEEPISNLSLIKDQIVDYHDSGKWNEDIQYVINEAKTYLASQLGSSNRLAVVIDIDETALSKWEQMHAADFAELPDLFDQWYLSQKATAILPTLEFYRFALDNGCSIFFISGRPEKFRQVTEANLKKVGYTSWEKVILRPNDYQDPSIIPFKKKAREQISKKGYQIIVNIGDQWSDLEGGFAERAFKLSNPAYFIP